MVVLEKAICLLWGFGGGSGLLEILLAGDFLLEILLDLWFFLLAKIGSLRLVGNPVGLGVFPVGEKLAIYGLLEIPLDFEKILLAFLWQFTAPLDFDKILLAFPWQFAAPLDFKQMLLACPRQVLCQLLTPKAPLDIEKISFAFP